jgi:hypothetical protein
MVSFTTAKLPIPKSWDEFEDIISDIIQIAWKDPFSIRNGRLGQSQNGVDIYGKPHYLKGKYSGVQCKARKISKSEIESEITKTKDFKPNLDEYIIATTSKRDSAIQEEVRLIDEKRVGEKKFSVRILFWEDICLKLSENEELMIKHFPQFIGKTASIDSIYKKIISSDASDWTFDDIGGIYIYKKDTDLTIRRKGLENSSSFSEEWVKRFPDPKAYTDEHIIYYGNTPIKRIYLANVDGARCSVPYPHTEDKTITFYQYKLGKIINDSFYGRDRAPHDFDSYLKRAKITALKE